jgi:hypothetical protein
VRIVDNVSQILDFSHGSFPFSGKDVGGEFTPVGREVEFERWRKDEEMI